MGARVYLIPRAALVPIFRGEKRISNLPPDAEIVASDYGVQGFGVRVHSARFAQTGPGEQLPVVPAVIEFSKPRAPAA